MPTIFRCAARPPLQPRIARAFSLRCRTLAIAMTAGVLALAAPQVRAQLPDAQDQAAPTSARFEVKWKAPTTLANGAPFKGHGLTGFKVYGSQTRYDLAPALLLTVKDPDATSASVPLSSGAWYLWVSATTEKGESELQYNSKVVSP